MLYSSLVRKQSPAHLTFKRMFQHKDKVKCCRNFPILEVFSPLLKDFFGGYIYSQARKSFREPDSSLI